MSTSAKAFASESLAPSTRKAYDGAYGIFEDYCVNEGINPLPAHPITLTNFLASLGDKEVALGTMEKCVAAISMRHALLCLPSPTTNPGVLRVLEGIRRKKGKPAKQKQPLTASMISRLTSSLSPDSEASTWRTVWRLVVSFFGLLRFSEISSLRRRDVSFFEGGMKIFLASSKTDQRKKGAEIFISSNSDLTLCPISITHSYFKKFGFQPQDYLQPKCVGNKLKGDRISYSIALSDTKKLLTTLGYEGASFAEHSARRGGATAAAANGASSHDIQLHGRWSSSKMPDLYTERTVSAKLALTKKISRQ